jgi:hypothetical protein
MQERIGNNKPNQPDQPIPLRGSKGRTVPPRTVPIFAGHVELIGRTTVATWLE